MQRILLAAATVALLALPSAANADTLTGAAIGAGSGAIIAGPPGAVVGGVIGAAVGGPDIRRHRHRHCWWSHGHRRCGWR